MLVGIVVLITLGIVLSFLIVLEKASSVREIEKQKEGWRIFYQKFFGINLDVSIIKIPKKKSGFDRLIIVAQGLTINQAYEKCTENFPCIHDKAYTDNLDKKITRNDRSPSKASYAIWIRDRSEADEKLKNISADELKQKNIFGITFLERLLYELKYWVDTGNHLDIHKRTLCSSSRDSDGFIPSVDWCFYQLRVDRADPNFRYEGLGLGVRTVIQ